MEKCFVAVSGGVDSAVALLLLKNKGYSVEGITMRVFSKELVPDATDKEIEDAKNLCNSLGVTHHLIDLSQEFRVRVIGDFISAYANGETPNPCIVCNKYIKFGALSDYAFSHGAQKYATGHYVRTANVGDRRVIVRAKDNDKDHKSKISKPLSANFQKTKSAISRAKTALPLQIRVTVRIFASFPTVITARFWTELQEKPTSSVISCSKTERSWADTKVKDAIR